MTWCLISKYLLSIYLFTHLFIVFFTYLFIYYTYIYIYIKTKQKTFRPSLQSEGRLILGQDEAQELIRGDLFSQTVLMPRELSERLQSASFTYQHPQQFRCQPAWWFLCHVYYMKASKITKYIQLFETVFSHLLVLHKSLPHQRRETKQRPAASNCSHQLSKACQ